MPKDVRVFLNLFVESRELEKVTESLVKLPEVTDVFEVTGEYDIVVMLKVENILSFRELLKNKVVTARDYAEGIIAEANNGGYTVVLLTKRRIRSGLGKIFHKSISEEVIRYTNTLVLTFLAEPQVEEMKR